MTNPKQKENWEITKIVFKWAIELSDFQKKALIKELLGYFKSHWLQMVGEDKTINKSKKFKADDRRYTYGYNQAKAELRKKVEEGK